MACGQCEAARRRREKMAQEAIAAKSDKVGSTPIVYSQGKKLERVARSSVCGHLYDEIIMLHNKCNDLYQRTRFDGTGDEYHWLETQRKLVAWKTELNDKCPDEEEYGVVKTLINNEYIKLFQK